MYNVFDISLQKYILYEACKLYRLNKILGSIHTNGVYIDLYLLALSAMFTMIGSFFKKVFFQYLKYILTG